MMGLDEEIVDAGVSRFGLHRVHVVRFGEAPDREARIAECVPAEADPVSYLEYEEQPLNLHHLWLFWKDGQDG